MSKGFISNLFGGEAYNKYRIGANIFTHGRQRERVTELLKIAESRGPMTKVLDCPSGTGRVSVRLFAWVLTCADITINRLEDVKENYPDQDIKTQHCDIFDLPFSDNEFDLTMCCLLIQHIDKEKLHPMLKELRRVSNKWLIVTYPPTFSLVNGYRLLRRPKKTTLTSREFRNLVTGAGFRIEATRTILPLIVSGKVVLLGKISDSTES
jgi:hypothetical protein